jgi:hypothetical protein
MQPVDPNTLVTNAVWQRAQEPPSAGAGMHRLVWDFRPTPPTGGRGGRGSGGAAVFGRGALPATPPGNYTVRLTVNGKAYTQPLTLLRDPRTR